MHLPIGTSVSGPADDAVAAQGAALAGTVDHQHRNAALQAAMRLHEPHLVLDRVEAAHADHYRQLLAGERRAHEITADRLARLVGDVDRFAGRIEPRDEFLRAGFHPLEGRQPPRVVRLEVEFGLPVVIRGAKEAVHRRTDVAGLLLGEAARPVAVGDAHPLDVPAFVVAGDHAACRLEDFADRAAAFLRLAETAAELVGEPGMLRPVMPAERLVMRRAVGGDLLDGIVGAVGNGDVACGHGLPHTESIGGGRCGYQGRSATVVMCSSAGEVRQRPMQV